VNNFQNFSFAYPNLPLQYTENYKSELMSLVVFLCELIFSSSKVFFHVSIIVNSEGMLSESTKLVQFRLFISVITVVAVKTADYSLFIWGRRSICRGDIARNAIGILWDVVRSLVGRRSWFISRNFASIILKNWENTYETSIKIASNPSEILKLNLSNTSIYCYRKLICRYTETSLMACCYITRSYTKYFV
jgi:hypothetical protein